jgi:AcrR family transcriptional regulator
LTGNERRREAKKRKIQHCALELFNEYGFDKVTLEEIARKASVSRVTVYKYFVDKDNLYLEILKNLALQTTEEIEKIVKNNLPFSQKFQQIILQKRDITALTDNQLISATISTNGELGGVVTPELQNRIALIIKKFIEQGKEEGYIHSSLTPDTINNYFKLIRAGLKQLKDNNDPLLNDFEKLEGLISIYIKGLKYPI